MKSLKKKVTLSLDSKTYDEFHVYCDNNAIMLSKKIEIWIQEFLSNVKGKSRVSPEGQKK